MAYYDAFIAKWATLPPGTTEQKLATLNAEKVTGPAIPMIVPAYTIYNLIDPAEFVALADANKQLVRDILFMGTVDASPGNAVRSRLMATFAAGSVTRTKLAQLAAPYDTPQIPWLQENGYPRPFDMGDCAAAGVS